MGSNLRMTAQALKVLKVFVERPRDKLSGAEISRATGIGSGTLYPLLARFEGVGWLVSEWEAVDPSEVGRPRRRLYAITALGQSTALREFAEFQLTNPGAMAWH